mgnify:FL=1
MSALGAGLAFGLALSALAQGNAGHTDTISPVASRSMDDGAMQLLEKQAEVPEGCYKYGMFYVHPHKLPGSSRTQEASPRDCQLRCARSHEPCAQFSWWPDGGCLLSGEKSVLQAAPYKWSAVVVGPSSCDELSAYEVVKVPSSGAYCSEPVLFEGPSSGLTDCKDKCDGNAECRFFSLWSTGGLHWCRLTRSCHTFGQQEGQSIATYQRREVALPGGAGSVSSKLIPGIHGKACAAYPQCKSARVQGNCCPTDEGVTLSCCSQLPDVSKSIATSSDCAAIPACAKKNQTGACCPTANGIHLPCCAQI